MDLLLGASFQPIQARAYNDAYTRAQTAGRTARRDTARRMEVTGAVPARTVAEKQQDSRFAGSAWRPRGRRLQAVRAPAGASLPAAFALREAYPLSFAGVLALYYAQRAPKRGA